MPKITTIFNKLTGEAKVEAHGFVGPACADATKFLHDTLGTCTDWQYKASWYETNLERSGEINTSYCG